MEKAVDMSSLAELFQRNSINDFEELGHQTGVFLSFNANNGWSLCKLNRFEQLMRSCFGFYEETHFQTIIKGLIYEKKVSLIPNCVSLAQRINEILYRKEIESGRSIEMDESLEKGPFLFRSTIKPHNFCSNFFPSFIIYNDRFYSSVEVAYQALKFEGTAIANTIIFGTAKESKLLANRHKDEVPYDWNNKKLDIMKVLVHSKFSLNIDLQKRLMATQSRLLVEHTDDSFWGDGNQNGNEVGMGENHLGKILEAIRCELLVDKQ